VDAAARGGANVMPPILAAVEAQATLGEISDRLRAVFGRHQETFAF
jgi:methylmalonyl-CoA mutase N-terminal domain/subunit